MVTGLDSLCNHVVVNTGQNYDPALYDIFFDDLGLRPPDYVLDCKSDTLMRQVGAILAESEHVLSQENPDRLLLLGDTNSALSAIVAKRMHIPVFHMEAGNRCYDDRVPEEVNRRIIDHCSDVLLPYTERSRKNLLREGIGGERIYVTGNPINEVLRYYDERIINSKVLHRLSLTKKGYILVTMHREENVDDEERLSNLTDALDLVQKEYKVPVVCSLHPRTRKLMENFGIVVYNENIRFFPPLGFFDFVHLERNAFLVLSDSGTVQEECCIFEVPNVTVRDVTERPETLECGSNILSGAEAENILHCCHVVMERESSWSIPDEYLRDNVSNAVIKIILGYR